MHGPPDSRCLQVQYALDNASCTAYIMPHLRVYVYIRSGGSKFDWSGVGSTKRAEPGTTLVRACARVLQLLIIGPATARSPGPVPPPLLHRISQWNNIPVLYA